MNCAWSSLIKLLPERYKYEVDKHRNDGLQEIRFRESLKPTLVFQDHCSCLQTIVTVEDLRKIINYACQYSPWAAETISSGYITAPGGHRVGVFGRFSSHNDRGWVLQTPLMLNLRVCCDFPGIAAEMKNIGGSILIIGPPGCGKTTLLRDFVRQRSGLQKGSISVVDEREEVFPRSADSFCFYVGDNIDVLSGCTKKDGINWALRNMTPATIALDEITEEDDCDALIHAAWCGVNLIATAHAGNQKDLLSRPIYKEIMQAKIFNTLIILEKDKRWRVERIPT